MSGILGIIIGVAACIGIAYLLRNYAVQNEWSKTKWWSISCCGAAVILFGLSFLINGGGSYDKNGYAYVVRQLKAPTTAELVSSINKSEFSDILKEECNINLPNGLEAEYYEIASQNGFGAQVTGEFVVFFWHGKPIHAEENGLQCFESNQSWSMTKYVLEHNAGINLD